MSDSSPKAAPTMVSPGLRTNAWASFVVVVIALVLGAVLSSGRIVDMAERKPLGDERDRWLSVAEPIASFASTTRLDKPQSVVDGWLGRSTTTPEFVLPTTTTSTVPLSTTTTALPPTSATGPSTTTSRPTTTQPSTTQPTTTQPTTTTTQPTTTVAPRRSISAQAPLVVLAAGDSLGEYIGQELKVIAADASVGDVLLDYSIATGLTRPDYFDWPSHLNEGLAVDRATDAVLFMVGGNDDQPMIVDGQRLATASPEWVEEYRTRAGLLMDIAESHGTYIVWVGLPPMQDERRQMISLEINRVVAEEAAVRSRSSYFDPAPLLLEGDETYSLYVTSPDGELRKARAPDGVHITRQASRWIAQAIWEQMSVDWPQEPPTTTTTP